MTLIQIIEKGGWPALWKHLVSGGIFATNASGGTALNTVVSKLGNIVTQGNITGTGAGTGFALSSKTANIQIVANGSHAGTTTIDVEVSIDGGTTWGWGATLAVTGAGVTDQFHAPAVWALMRYNCTGFGSAGSVAFNTEEL